MDTTTYVEQIDSILADLDTNSDTATVRADLTKLRHDLYASGLIQAVLVRFTRHDGAQFYSERAVQVSFHNDVVRLETIDPDPALMHFVFGGEATYGDDSEVTGWTMPYKSSPDLQFDVWSLKVASGVPVGFVRWSAGLEPMSFESVTLGGRELALPVLKADVNPGTFGFHVEPHLPDYTAGLTTA